MNQNQTQFSYAMYFFHLFCVLFSLWFFLIVEFVLFWEQFYDILVKYRRPKIFEKRPTFRFFFKKKTHCI